MNKSLIKLACIKIFSISISCTYLMCIASQISPSIPFISLEFRFLCRIRLLSLPFQSYWQLMFRVIIINQYDSELVWC